MEHQKTENKEYWLQKRWRPFMAGMYLIVCTCDFIVFPILWSILQAYYDGQVTSQWDPLTLKGAGLFHMAMGAVLGVAAWSRGQEKIAGVANTAPQPINNPAPIIDPPTRNTRND